MGSLVSLIVANICMENLEQDVMTSSLEECKPRLCKRYLDDTLEIIKKGSEDKLTKHFNTVDTNNTTHFTKSSE